MTAVMNFSVAAGLEIIALPRFNLNEALKTIHKKRPHLFPAVPAIYSGINNHPDLKKFNISSLRYCISGGAPLPAEVKRTFERITGCVVVEGYGLTESSPVVCANPIKGENKAGSIGMPLPGTIVEIVNPADKTTIMPPGERGELCVRGPQVMKGYYNKPLETSEVLKDGRLHTGDIAIMDARGYVYIVDRIKDMIITNGYNVYPRNVEEAVYLHPSVEECIVAGPA
jgi:long-chain acyl-CoA synthetase